jgi:hypothetical protein
VTDWLYAQAGKRNVSIDILTPQIEERQSDYYAFIRIPVNVSEEIGAYESAKNTHRLAI